MKVYIPFNSNDFNSVFSTLSISPRAFYTLRNYSFKRSTLSYLNPFENFLLCYDRPIVFKQNNDEDQGYPVLLEVNIDSKELEELSQEGLAKLNLVIEPADKVRLFFLPRTLYLLDEFKVVFRTKGELEETFAKTLKSIETKFAGIAKGNAKIAFDYPNHVVTEAKVTLKANQLQNKLDQNLFVKERMINKAIGAIMGFALGGQRNFSPEINRLQLLKRELNNVISLYINSLQDNGYNKIKDRVEDCLNEINEVCEKEYPLDHELIIGSSNGFKAQDLSELKEFRIFNQPIYKLVIEGLLANEHGLDDLPLQLKVEIANRALKQRFHPKGADKYVSKLNDRIAKVRESIEKLIDEKKKSQDLQSAELLKIICNAADPFHWQISAPLNVSEKEKAFLTSIIQFFISNQDIQSPDELLSRRKGLLVEIGKRIPDLKGSKEGEFLGKLHKSFDSLRAQFDVNSASLDSLKSLAILFTSGRDFLKYQENVAAAEIEKKQIPYAIWGVAYGYATLPKTITEDFFDSGRRQQLVLNIIRDFLLSVRVNEEIISVAAKPEMPVLEKETEPNLFVSEPISNYKEAPNEVGEGKSDFLMLFEKKLRDDEKLKKQEKFINAALSCAKMVEKNEVIFGQSGIVVNEFKVALKERVKDIKGAGPKAVEGATKFYKELHEETLINE